MSCEQVLWVWRGAALTGGVGRGGRGVPVVVAAAAGRRARAVPAAGARRRRRSRRRHACEQSTRLLLTTLVGLDSDLNGCDPPFPQRRLRRGFVLQPRIMFRLHGLGTSTRRRPPCCRTCRLEPVVPIRAKTRVRPLEKLKVMHDHTCCPRGWQQAGSKCRDIYITFTFTFQVNGELLSWKSHFHCQMKRVNYLYIDFNKYSKHECRYFVGFGLQHQVLGSSYGRSITISIIERRFARGHVTSSVSQKVSRNGRAGKKTE